MGLGPAAIKMNLELFNRGFLKDRRSVVDMGSQGLHLNLADFEELLHMAGMDDYKKENFSALAHWPNGPECSSRFFYEVLGIKDYACIDLGKEHGAIPLDLNCPLEDKSLYGKYDLVTDYGTNEHVFNTSEAFRTMHRLCKVGGILVIAQVVYRGNGYYSYNPSFFEEMAEANNYKILSSSYTIGTVTLKSNGSQNQFHVPVSTGLIDALDWTKVSELGINFVCQKRSDADFCYPYQEGPLSTLRQNQGYPLQFLQSPPSYSHSYVPTIPENIHGKDLLAECRERVYDRIRSCLSLRFK